MTELAWQEKIGKKVIEYIKDELYLEFPFMGPAFSTLAPIAAEERESYSTDGTRLFFPTEKYLKLFETNELYLKRAYLHVILHCLNGHLWLRGERNPKLFGLACDICVEKQIDEAGKKNLTRILTWNRQRIYEYITRQNLNSPALIYEYLLTQSEEILTALYIEFHVDDHDLWPKGNKPGKSSLDNSIDPAEKKWQSIARQTKLNKDQSQDMDQAASSLLSQLKVQREKHTYSDFLRKFAKLTEEIKLSDEEFDLAFYNYGLITYGNIPLIEPLESKETPLLRNFVIAVDTSASTSGDLVKRFLLETSKILLEDMYSRDVNIYLIQCDDAVRSECKITKECDLESFFGSFEIIGGGNTDFVPVFEHVKKGLENGSYPSIDGLIYFTDGQGRYPKLPPKFKSAFIYLSDYDEDAVPGWAIKFKPENI